jgi:iron(III) transport system ATP-binding protein
VTEPLLVCSGLSKRFGSTVALRGADLTVYEHELLALLGPSGCGKTTMLRLIAGFEHPDAGVIRLRDRLVASPAQSLPPERRRVSMVFQDFALFPHLNVAANVAFGLPRGVDRSARVASLLALVQLGGLEARMPHQLSGGQQQRVALARALASEPDLLLLDEPFSNLDPSVRAEVRREVRDLIRSVGITAIFVTHDQEEALSLAGRVAVMMEGVVLQTGTPIEIYARPVSRAVGEFVGTANVLPGRLSDGQVECEIGHFAVADARSGAVDVLIRAEALVLTETGGARGEVVDIDFYGHDQMATVRLRSGTELRVRLLSAPRLQLGQEIGVVAAGEVLAFPSGA